MADGPCHFENRYIAVFRSNSNVSDFDGILYAEAGIMNKILNRPIVKFKMADESHIGIVLTSLHNGLFVQHEICFTDVQILTVMIAEYRKFQISKI